MKTLDKIKLAAAQLTPDEQSELFRWWTDSDVFKKRHLETLRKEITVGIEQLEAGQFQTCDENTFNRLADEIKTEGRNKLRRRMKNS
ncbi:MAG: hypothetical protein FJ403_04895 [Verrucomicrobia bacterium]|nr:hypothetical protein [Verrucomicrobiota bacterium]